MTTTLSNYPALLLCDYYKLSHKPLFPADTEVLSSMWIARSNKYFKEADKVNVFGIQFFVKEFLINYFEEKFFSRSLEDVLEEYIRVPRHTLNIETPDVSHIKELWELGYLPLEIRALPEGTLAPIKTPILTIQNTDKRFFWLPAYLETLMSTTLWKPMTSATIALQYRKLSEKYALATVGNTEGVQFQCHDFSMRGMSSLDSAIISGAAHLTAHIGTDTIASILFHEKYYNANIEDEQVGASIPATEHSIMSSYTDADGDRDEYDAFHRILTEVHPTGFVSIVSDTYDLFKVLTETLPRLHDIIMNRDGRLVVRPDSGNPVDILCGTLITPLYDDVQHASERLKADAVYFDNSLNRHMKFNVENKEAYEYNATPEEKGVVQLLWEEFGGTITDKGFKLLDSHIGTIYGDSITLERAEDIFKRLSRKGFASTNVVLGIGSYTYNYNTRDTLGFAMKATYGEYGGKARMLFKDPITDDGTKRSLRGKAFVYRSEVTGEIEFMDRMMEDYDELDGRKNLLEVVFKDGKLMKETSLKEIRELISSQL